MLALIDAPTRMPVADVAPITLRPYQQAAIGAIKAATREGVRRQLVQLPTGAGKTVVFADVIRQRHPRGRALVLAHRDELVQQAAEKLAAVLPEEPIGILKAARRDSGAYVLVASVQSLARPERLASIGGGWATVTIDEAHHAPARTYQDILKALGAFTPTGPLVLGFTATPVRADDAALDATFERLVYQYPLAQMIAEGWLAPLRGVRVQVDVNLDTVRRQGGDFVARDLGQQLADADAPGAILSAWQEHAAGLPTLVFTPTVALAAAVAQAFQAAGIAAEHVSGRTPTEERRGLLRALRDGELTVLANCGVLTEGFDEPSLQCLVMARPTQSLGLYLQMLGRGTRPYPGKRECLILDVVGVSATHRDQLGGDWALERAGSKRQAATLDDALSPAERAAPATVRALTLAEDSPTLLPVPPQALRTWPISLLGDGGQVQMLGDSPTRGVRGAWLRHQGKRGECWILPAGKGGPTERDAVYLVRPVISGVGGSSWNAVRVAGATIEGGSPLSELSGALAFAEAHAASLGEESLILRARRWRSDPASERQLDALARRGIDTTAIQTKGQAQLAFALHAVRRWL